MFPKLHKIAKQTLGHQAKLETDIALEWKRNMLDRKTSVVEAKCTRERGLRFLSISWRSVQTCWKTAKFVVNQWYVGFSTVLRVWLQIHLVSLAGPQCERWCSTGYSRASAMWMSWGSPISQRWYPWEPELLELAWEAALTENWFLSLSWQHSDKCPPFEWSRRKAWRPSRWNRRFQSQTNQQWIATWRCWVLSLPEVSVLALNIILWTDARPSRCSVLIVGQTVSMEKDDVICVRNDLSLSWGYMFYLPPVARRKLITENLWMQKIGFGNRIKRVLLSTVASNQALGTPEWSHSESMRNFRR